MITVKTSKQIPTSKMIRSFRSGGSANHLRYAATDRGRIASGYNQMLTHEEIRQWRNHLWRQHRLKSLSQ